MKSSFSRSHHNPLDLIKNYWPDADISHIEYEPSLKKGQYSIIRQCGGDGTLLFTIEMFQKALIPLLNKQSFFTKLNPDWNLIKDIRYKIGPIKHATVRAMVQLNCGKYPGQRERIRIPVICEIIT